MQFQFFFGSFKNLVSFKEKRCEAVAIFKKISCRSRKNAAKRWQFLKKSRAVQRI